MTRNVTVKDLFEAFEFRGGDQALVNEQILLLAPIDKAGKNALSFANDSERIPEGLKGAYIFVPGKSTELNVARRAGSNVLLFVENPRYSFSLAVKTLWQKPAPRTISDRALVSESANLGGNIHVGFGTVISSGAEIGDATIIGNNVVIAENVAIGKRCVIKSNTVIGEDGFGIVNDPHGKNFRVPHLGGVVIGDDVEIGSLCTVCSGTIEPTRIGNFVKLDDHIHVAHNVSIGENSIVTACAEISGSVDIGRNVWIAPNCSINSGVSIADDSFLGIGTVVSKSLKEVGAKYVGVPARKIGSR
ncbi:MAG: hypothetical protein Pars93KO_27950 [Parasphingorhabdus sp.]